MKKTNVMRLLEQTSIQLIPVKKKLPTYFQTAVKFEKLIVSAGIRAVS